MAAIMTFCTKITATLNCQRCRRRKKGVSALLTDYEACPMTGNTDGVCPVTLIQMRGFAAMKKGEGNKLFQEGHFEAAVSKYSESIKMMPLEAVYRLNRSKAYTKLDKNSEALADAQKAVDLDGTNVKAHWQLVQCARKCHGSDAALSALEKAWCVLSKEDPDNSPLLHLERELQGLTPLKPKVLKRVKPDKEKFAAAISGNSNRKNTEEVVKPDRVLEKEARHRREIEACIEKRKEMRRTAMALLEEGAPEKSVVKQADEKLAALEKIRGREMDRDSKDNKSEETTDVPDDSTDNEEKRGQDIEERSDSPKSEEGKKEEEKEETDVKGGEKDEEERVKEEEVEEVGAVKDVGEVGAVNNKTKKAKTKAAYKMYTPYQEEELTIEGGHKYLPRPTHVDLPSNYQEQIGVVTADEMYEMGNCNSDRLFLSVFGDIFDVSDRPDKYGKRGIYWELAGKDITYGLSIGNDTPQLANKFYDLYKAEDPSSEIVGISGWLYHFKREYGPAVGKLKEYEDESYHLPAPPINDEKPQCCIQ